MKTTIHFTADDVTRLRRALDEAHMVAGDVDASNAARANAACMARAYRLALEAGDGSKAAPAYPAAVRGYAPDAATLAMLHETAAASKYTGPFRDALRVALAVAEANRAAAEAAHWSRELAAPRPVETPIRSLSAETLAECAKVAAGAADAPLYAKGQGAFKVEVRP